MKFKTWSSSWILQNIFDDVLYDGLTSYGALI